MLAENELILPAEKLGAVVHKIFPFFLPDIKKANFFEKNVKIKWKRNAIVTSDKLLKKTNI